MHNKEAAAERIDLSAAAFFYFIVMKLIPLLGTYR